MKKSTLLIFLVLALVKIPAQNYLVSFAGSGAATEVNTIKVDNLTSGATVKLNGGDILHLVPLTETDHLNIKDGNLQISPNPMTELSVLTFFAPENGNAVISVVELSGRTVYQFSELLSPGSHSFRISGFKPGMYLVKIAGRNYCYSAKLITRGSLQSAAVIEPLSPDKKITHNYQKSAAAAIDMPYKNGDRLLYKGISGIYSTIITDVPTGSKTMTFNFAACTDADNNHYPIVQIGSQVWMAENLKTTKYNDATPIPLVSDNTAWTSLTTPGYCWYANDEATYKNTYGAMYNWYAVNTGKLAPAGWHVPVYSEWIALATSLGGPNLAGGKLKETGITHWKSPNTGATNESGFTGLPGGWRASAGHSGNFYEVAVTGEWWSATESSNTYPSCFYLDYWYSKIIEETAVKTVGFNIRCVKDISVKLQ